MSAQFEITDQVTHHSWQHIDRHGPGRERTSLIIDAPSKGPVRGTVNRPGHYHHHLALDGFELLGPAELDEVLAQRARTALAQLRLREDGQPHTDPHPDGSWSASVQLDCQISDGAQAVRAHLKPGHEFWPSRVIAYASTDGGGKLHLFADGPIMENSADFNFTPGADGTVQFSNPNPFYDAPAWLHGLARQVVGLAFGQLDAADSVLKPVS
ncbi:hypothetical protein LG293_17860 (plasmid) [Citricoccus nitrophenolicus]